MPKVLTTNAIVTCPHGGLGTSVPSDPKWLVNGGIVLLENDTGTLKCPFVPLRCNTYKLQSMKLNATVVDGRKVMLVTDFNLTDTGLPLRFSELHTTIDDSTPTPIPPGQGPPQLPAGLADLVKPIVQAVSVPSPLVFSTNTNLPPIATVTFTLSSDHPLKWILTLISDIKPKAKHVDLTYGAPDLSLAPVGGSWDTTILVVTMIMSSTYMAALQMGTHDFFMTGVSQRGLFGFVKVELTVS